MANKNIDYRVITKEKYGINYIAWKYEQTGSRGLRWFGPFTLGEIEDNIVKIWFDRRVCAIINAMRDLQGEAPGKYNHEKAVDLFHKLANAEWFKGGSEHISYVEDLALGIKLYLPPINDCIRSEEGLPGIAKILEDPTSVGKRIEGRELEELLNRIPSASQNVFVSGNLLYNMLSENQEEIREEMKQGAKDFIMMMMSPNAAAQQTLWMIKDLKPAIQELVLVEKLFKDEEGVTSDADNNNNNNQ